MKKLLRAFCFMAVLLMPATAMADVITDWSYSTSGMFLNMTFGGPGTLDGIAGPTGAALTLGYDTPAGKQTISGYSAYHWGTDTANSGVTIEGGSGTITTDGSSVSGVSVTHHNKTLNSAYKLLTGGTIFSAVTLTNGNNSHTVGNSLDFNFLETYNYGVGYDDDIFFMTNSEIMKSLGSFVLDGVEYYVAIYTRLRSLTGEYLRMAQEAIGVGNDVMLYGWTTKEGETITNAYDLSLTVSLTPPTVPVPAAVWLMGTGIAGLAALRRRANKIA